MKNYVLIVLLSCFGVVLPLQAESNKPPNFIIILADDMGYGDLGSFGSKVNRTPNLDRMAKEGLKLTSFYVASSVCSPSRAALLTGSYPRRVGLHESPVGSPNRFVLFPGSSRGLNPNEITVAEILKKRGYATGIVGKWHLGDQPEFLPTRQGFDSYFGIPYSNDMGHGTNSSYPPLPLMRGERVVEQEPDQSLLTQRYTQEAIEFIQAHQGSPFFLYLPHTMPHYPHFASERFKGKSANEIYGDAIEELDWSVGEILKKLRELRIDGRTLVVFTSDNGGVPPPTLTYRGSNAPLRGTKGSAWEGGFRVPAVVRWPGRIPAGTVSDAMVLSMDLLPTFAKLAGAAAPSDRVIDGRDAWPVLARPEKAVTPHDRFYYYELGYLAAVRSGQWKLHVIRAEFNKVKDRVDMGAVLELYDLKKDIGETTNVAAQHPDVVKRLQALLADAREDIGDDQTGDAGKNTRPAGEVAMPKTLTTLVPATSDPSIVHVQAFDLPVSSLLSPQSRAVLARQRKEDEELGKLCVWKWQGTSAEDIKAYRACAEKHFFPPLLARFHARYAVTIEPKILAGVRTEIFTPEEGLPSANADMVLINVHGGSYMGGGRWGGQVESIPISAVGKFRVVSIDYRMAPEYKYPAASQDVEAVYRELLKTYAPQNIGIYGCSAGGELTGQAVAWLQSKGLPSPGAVGMFCAAANFWGEGDSGQLAAALSGRPEEEVVDSRKNPYLEDVDPNDPIAFPIRSRDVMAKFPPSLLIASTRDIGLSSAAHTQSVLVASGVEAELHVWEGLNHYFFAEPDLPESREVYDVVAKFFARHLGSQGLHPPSR